MSSDTIKGNLKSSKGVVVKSRYKQAAENFSQQTSKEKSSLDTRRKDETLLKQSTTIWSDDSVMSKCTSINKHTSTPDSHNHILLPPLDASAITDASGFLCLPHTQDTVSYSAKGMTLKKPLHGKSRDMSRRCPSVTSQNTKTSNTIIKDSETELDIYYAQYLQAKLMETNTKKAFELRAKNALEKIKEVYLLINTLLEKKRNTQKKINFASQVVFLHNHLDRQDQMLKSIFETIPLLKKQYEEIAFAIDAVSHKLEVKNFVNPCDITEDDFLHFLEKMNNFLNAIEISVENRNEIIESSVVINNTAIQAKLIADEIKRGSVLFSECQEILLSETNLKLS